MNTRIGLVCILLTCCGIALGQDKAEFRRLSAKDYRDKMQGGWLGQMIGVGWGAPTEFKSCGKIIPSNEMPPWQPEMVNQHGNDDCYVEMTFLKTLEDFGLDVSIRQAGIDFAKSGYELWHANDAGRKNLRQGISAPNSGHPQFNKHADDIDYQIESDFAGIVSPGLPQQAIALGDTFGHLMNYGDGVYAGQFIASMYSEAFFETDMPRLIQAALRSIPAESQYAEMVRDMLRWHQENPNDWEKTWQQVEQKYHSNPEYSHGLCCGAGGKDHSSIDVKLNGAYILMGLLYGNGDPDKTMTIACRCGQDSDCNPSNAAGILFTATGASKIPTRFVEKLDQNAKYSHSDYNLPKVYKVSEKLARMGVVKAGGRIERSDTGAAADADVLVIPVQSPKPSKFEQSCRPGPIADNGNALSGEKAQPISLIFDTDIGNDIDDALALALIHALESCGECKLLAVTITKDNSQAAPFVNIINTFYGRGSVPIGVVRHGITPEESVYLRAVVTPEDNGKPRYPRTLRDGREAPEATVLLRKTLAGQPDHSVVIAQVGFSTNLARLLNSKPDDVSPLDGMELVKRKVRLLSAMAGRFTPAPDGKPYAEYNVVMDVPSAKQVFEHWPTPVVFSGFEIGEVIEYPARGIEHDYNYVPHHPVAEAYRAFQKMPYDRPTWDLTAVLYAVRPDQGYFGLSPQGKVAVEKSGVTRFEADVNGSQRYLTLTPEQKKKVLETFLKLCSQRPSGS